MLVIRAGATGVQVASIFNARDERNGIYAGSLESNESKLILRGDTYTVYASGHLLFWRDGALMAQPFDEKILQLTGDAVQIAEQVQFDQRLVGGEFSVSGNGILVFVSGSSTLGQLVWFDRAGRQVGKVGDPAIVSDPRISPDGKRIAVKIYDPEAVSSTSNIWVYDLARENVKTRFTTNPASDAMPIWCPDGSRIGFSSNWTDHQVFDIYQKDSSGSGNEELLLESDGKQFPSSFSSDGRFIAYSRISPDVDKPSLSCCAEIWIFPLVGERKPFPFLQSQTQYSGYGKVKIGSILTS